MSHLIKHPAAICSTDPDGQILSARSTADVFDDHLRPRIARRLEDDLRRNYAPDVVLLTCNSIFRGHDGLRESARRLGEQLPMPGSSSRLARSRTNPPFWCGPHSRTVIVLDAAPILS